MATSDVSAERMAVRFRLQFDETVGEVSKCCLSLVFVVPVNIPQTENVFKGAVRLSESG